jgi:ABC-type branched-subunit amino acid transport system substrate-binding protein
MGENTMAHRGSLVTGAVSVALTMVLVASAVNASGADAQAPTDPGVTAKSVKLGYIFSETGVAASSFKNAGKACQARVDRQNAQGGVNGRKIEMEIVDDQSSAANLTAAQDLVENRDVFAVVNNSSFGFLTWRYLKGANVPLIGGGYDGDYYSHPGNEDLISALGNVSTEPGLTNSVFAKAIKMLGGTKVAGLGYGASPSSANSVKANMDYAMATEGLESVYTNTSIDFGSSDVGPIVLGVKNAGADSLFAALVAATGISVLQGLQQNGVKMKANILATGYGQDLLDSPAAATLGTNTLFYQQYKPVELKDKATKRFQADLKKYAGLTGVPDYGQYLGYITCELAILGLEHAGKTPTRRGFIDGIRKLGTYDAAGLSCGSIDISLERFGENPNTDCGYFTYVKDGKFVIFNKGKPIVGKLVGSKEALAANAAKGVSTTTVAPTTVAP